MRSREVNAISMQRHILSMLQAREGGIYLKEISERLNKRCYNLLSKLKSALDIVGFIFTIYINAVY